MVKLGIIGTGAMAHVHVSGYRAAGGAKVVACCDIVAKTAAEFAKNIR